MDQHHSSQNNRSHCINNQACIQSKEHLAIEREALTIIAPSSSFLHSTFNPISGNSLY